MIEIKRNQLRFSFPEVHPKASMTIDFQRTLRIPDDDRTYPLPPGLGSFPLSHVDDHADRVSETWKRHGGVMLPMYQSEAMWLNFDASDGYAFAVKIAAGKINAVTGDPWVDGLAKRPQNYLPVPEQPWLDGFCVEKGLIRQFVAMPLGAGYSAEEQLTGTAEFGGLQVEVFPLKAKFYRPESYPTMAGACVQEAMICCAVADMGLAPRRANETGDLQRRASGVPLRSRPRLPLFCPPVQLDVVARGHRSEPAYSSSYGQGV
jgi:hypothetical protein